ncbi:hypothetical protein [Nostoc sp. DedQUE09]|uniref:hypothetical protein n=1 Tax=Nostoc sp. DedQUE09 TaxID=3075394 RepID=UPI002AD2BC0D|nr:hypothetical protein [Nostoc sp. DedQUE09]MDZ7952264.1 hypothetical protein [Nostoc sp. DedQUE09]
MVYQSYEELTKNHPEVNPYFSFLLDSQEQWIDHHHLAVDGLVMHLDKDNPNLLHLFRQFPLINLPSPLVSTSLNQLRD